jgi:hypothetical protein
VRAPWSSRCPRAGSGRDTIPGPAPDDRPVLAAVTPGHRRAEGRDPGRPAPTRPGHPDVGVVRVAVTCAFTAMARSGRRPRHRRAARDRPRLGRDRAGMAPSWLGPVRHRLMSGYAVTGAGLSDARFPWLPRGPGSDGLAPGHPRGCRHGLAEWLARRPVCPCGQPLVPTGPRSPVRIFSNHTVLAGAPLRNRTVDLLLTI